MEHIESYLHIYTESGECVRERSHTSHTTFKSLRVGLLQLTSNQKKILCSANYERYSLTIHQFDFPVVVVGYQQRFLSVVSRPFQRLCFIRPLLFIIRIIHAMHNK